MCKYVKYSISDGQDEKIVSRVLFTGPGINSAVYRTQQKMVGWFMPDK